MSRLLGDQFQRIKDEIGRLQERSAALDRVAAGPWQEGEPDEAGDYLIAWSVPEGHDGLLVAFWDGGRWLHAKGGKTIGENVLRYAEIYSSDV